MTVSPLTWTVILVIGLTLFGNSSGATWRNRQLPNGTGKGVPSQTVVAEKSLVMVKKRSASNGDRLHHVVEVDSKHKRKRRHLRNHNNLSDWPSEYGTFNQDTYSCDGIMSRQCQRPSDCDGCLGLFTCQMPQATCDFKGVSKDTGGFYQNLHRNREVDYGSF